MAWNEDTIHNYYIVLLRDSTFYYTIEEARSGKASNVSTWRGLYHYSYDTVYLRFQDNEKPPMCNYLINVVGDYFIQFLTTGEKMYLRKRQWGSSWR